MLEMSVVTLLLLMKSVSTLVFRRLLTYGGKRACRVACV